jgi:hypothetical protein
MLEEMVARMKLAQDWCPVVDFGLSTVENFVSTTIDAYHKELPWH